MMPAPDRLAAFFSGDRLRAIASAWIVVSVLGLAANLATTCLIDSPRPCTADYPDFAFSAWLALHGQARTAYAMAPFQHLVLAAVPHARDIYQFAYPPFLLLLTAPIGALPFWPGWVLWLAGGWVCFALLIRRLLPQDWALYSAALPAVFVNVVAGQNGFWTAAILGWGLTLLPRRPWRAGAILALMLYKPQLAFLIPLALLAGSRWRALSAFVAASLTLCAAATISYGPDIWLDFAHHSQAVRTGILEQGTGIFHRMISVFVLLRHLGASRATAYAAQAITTATVAAAVMLVWRCPASETLKHCTLVLGIALATPYVFDYDLAFLALVPPWLWRDGGVARWRLHAAILIALPLFVAPLAKQTGAALGVLFLVPSFAIVIRAANPPPFPGSRSRIRNLAGE